jgi:hemerythrin
MPLLDWRDEFETGIAYIDYEHQRLVALINLACENLSQPDAADRVAECLGELYGQVCSHFALEEQLMRERKYGLYDEHKADHEALLEDMRYMMDAYEAGACETCGTTLDECLVAWFHKHFRARDARLVTLRP